jgi:sulfonate transport system permease protein
LGIVRHVVLPSALPQLLVGLRLSLGIAWLALVFAEQISATSGLGYLMSTAQELLQTDTIVVCLVVYALLGLTVDLVVRALERLLLSWRPRAVGV